MFSCCNLLVSVLTGSISFERLCAVLDKDKTVETRVGGSIILIRFSLFCTKIFHSDKVKVFS